MPDVNANGIKIHYEERGSGDPLILIMGLSADGPVWEAHVEAYEKHFRCILMDNRGVGQSDKPEGAYSTEMMADDTAGLMDALNIEKAHVNGISMGGAIAQQLAIRHPNKVKSLVLVSTWAKCDPYSASIFEMFRKARACMKFEDFMELLQLRIFSPTHFNNNFADLQQGQKDAPNYEFLQPQHGFSGQCDACINHDTTKQLHLITQPTLITIGTADMFTPYPFSKTLHEQIKGSEMLEFPEWAHTHHWEDLEKFNSKTTEFLLKHSE